MYIGRVVGNVVATIKDEAFAGRKLLLVARLGLDGQDAGEAYDICVDVVQAGPGDRVLVIDEGNGARQILGRDPAPVRAVVVGIVDDVGLAPPIVGAASSAP
ncbi:MAG: EutN/CcmL family microcompartment protein [Candidatus Promineifilaceae bacterium]